LLGARLKAFREYRGLSQSEFAAAAGIKSSHMSAIEREESSPTVLVLEKLIESNQIDGRWLFGQLSRVEDADLRAHPESIVKATTVADRLAAIEERLAEAGAMAESFDPIAFQVRSKPALRDLVTLVKDYDAPTLREVRALAYGYVAGSSPRTTERYAGPLENSPEDMARPPQVSERKIR
jgi:transcriptional regulator with XRE-family HTH domain